jgi:hypothetical protein
VLGTPPSPPSGVRMGVIWIFLNDTQEGCHNGGINLVYLHTHELGENQNSLPFAIEFSCSNETAKVATDLDFSTHAAERCFGPPRFLLEHRLRQAGLLAFRGEVEQQQWEIMDTDTLWVSQSRQMQPMARLPRCPAFLWQLLRRGWGHRSVNRQASPLCPP